MSFIYDLISSFSLNIYQDDNVCSITVYDNDYSVNVSVNKEQGNGSSVSSNSNKSNCKEIETKLIKKEKKPVKKNKKLLK